MESCPEKYQVEKIELALRKKVTLTLKISYLKSYQYTNFISGP